MKRMLIIIWLIFTILFSSLGFIHLKDSKKSIAPFQLTKLEKNKVDVEFYTSLSGVDIEKPLRGFAHDFNSYLEEYNKSSHSQNRNAAYGYFLAALTALVSMFMSIKK